MRRVMMNLEVYRKKVVELQVYNNKTLRCVNVGTAERGRHTTE